MIANKNLLVFSLSILLVSCGGDGSSSSTTSTTSSTTKTTPSAKLEAKIKSLCKTNCNAIVPADNPSSRLEAKIKALSPNASTTVPADNPSVRLEKVVSDTRNGFLCASGEIAEGGCPNCGYGTPFNIQGFGTNNMTYQCQCNNGTVGNYPIPTGGGGGAVCPNP